MMSDFKNTGRFFSNWSIVLCKMVYDMDWFTATKVAVALYHLEYGNSFSINWSENTHRNTKSVLDSLRGGYVIRDMMVRNSIKKTRAMKPADGYAARKTLYH